MDPVTGSIIAGAAGKVLGPTMGRVGGWLSRALFGRKRNPFAEQLEREQGTENDIWKQRDSTMRQTRNSLVSMLAGGDDQTAALMKTNLEAAMPAFESSLQRTRAGANRRGISTGDLGTSYEGDITSAFDRNQRGAAAKLAFDTYDRRLRGTQSLYGMDADFAEGSRNRYLDLVSGNRDNRNAEDNAETASGNAAAGTAAGLAGRYYGQGQQSDLTDAADGDGGAPDGWRFYGEQLPVTAQIEDQPDAGFTANPWERNRFGRAMTGRGW